MPLTNSILWLVGLIAALKIKAVSHAEAWINNMDLDSENPAGAIGHATILRFQKFCMLSEPLGLDLCKSSAWNLQQLYSRFHALSNPVSFALRSNTRVS